jgi:hypothetical protein
MQTPHINAPNAQNSARIASGTCAVTTQQNTSASPAAQRGMHHTSAAQRGMHHTSAAQRGMHHTSAAQRGKKLPYDNAKAAAAAALLGCCSQSTATAPRKCHCIVLDAVCMECTAPSAYTSDSY